MRMIRRYAWRRIILCGSTGLALLAACALGRTAVAEESAHKVPLSYISGYSTWGPTDVYGEARVWPSEGEIALSIHFLPRLNPPGHYVSWITSRRTGQALRIGAFDTSDAGDALQDVILSSDLPDNADTVLITAYPHGGPDDVPGPDRSAAGFLSGPAPATTVPTTAPASTATPAPTATPEAKPGDAEGHNGHPGNGDAGRSQGSASESRGAHGAYPLVVALPATGGGPAAARQAHGHGDAEHTRHSAHRKRHTGK